MTGDVRVRLNKPLKRTLRRGHPWVFRDALARLEVSPGTIVTVVDERDRFVARGWADEGPIALRVMTTRDEPVDDELIARRISMALDLRNRVVPADTDTYRMLHGEGDLLPGVVCDVYGRFASMRIDGSAPIPWMDKIIEALTPQLEARGIEGLVVRTGRRGRKRVKVAWGKAPPDEVQVHEHGRVLCTNLLEGQKTGLFLDHRESRQRVERLSRDLRVLDLYAYAGAFSVAAGKGGAAHVVTVDVASPAIELARRAWLLNALPEERHELVPSDVPSFLAAQERSGRRFHLVIADPPSFASSAAARPKAIRAYVRLHQAALGLVLPGGFYLAASCSSHIDWRDFDDGLVEAADKSKRKMQVIDKWGPPPDHPRLLAFPEGDYLKAVLMRACD